MWKTHTLLGKALFMLADMDILLLVILLLSVAVIYNGKLETNIAKVCLTDSCSEMQFQWNTCEHLLSNNNSGKLHTCISQFPRHNQV